MTNTAKTITFNERMQKTIRFYDHSYHLHKATFKGLSEFYHTYTKVQKQYSQQLIRLSRNIWQDMPQLKKQNSCLLSTIKQVIQCLQCSSQLHFNYGQKLNEISAFYNSQYVSSKKKKQSHMKIIKDRNTDQYSRVRQKQKNNKQAIQQKQRQIYKQLYEGLEKLAEEENDRVQKIKQQSIIYFSVFRKVCQKQMERAAELNQKLIKQQFQIKNKGIQKIAQELRNSHNQYPGKKLDKSKFDISKTTMSFNRQSLRNSLLIKKRMTKINDYQSKVKIKLDQYSQLADQLIYVTMPDTDYAFFDNAFFINSQQRRRFSREIDGNIIKVICYQMLQSYIKANQAQHADSMVLLHMIKASLKVKATEPMQQACKNLNDFWVAKSNKDYSYRWHVKLLQILSNFYEKKCLKAQITDHLKKKIGLQQFIINKQMPLTFLVASAIISMLLYPSFSKDSSSAYLVDSYTQFIILISNFSQNFFKIQRNIVVLIVLRKYMYLINKQPKQQREQFQEILNDKYLTKNNNVLDSNPDKTMNVSQWCNNLLNLTTEKFLYFFEFKTPFINYVSIFFLVEKLAIRKQHFSAKQHIYISMRAAGFNYLKSMENSHKLLQTHDLSVTGEQRLKNLAEIFEELDYENFMKNYFYDSAKDISRLFGVSEKIARTKFFEEFTYAPLKIAEDNLGMIAQEQGVDREGYALRLGVIMGKIDILNPLPISQYQFFFEVLEKYLKATQKDYDQMLEQSRRTELWIMQDNQLATTNCIDFCSLLYKPFEFLLISLNKLQNQDQTDYIKKYTEFIKFRLNNQLKVQIVKYVKFLFDSLDSYKHAAPQLQFKPKRRQKPHYLQKQNVDNHLNVFKQVTRRMFNLLFLKEQLEQMMCDFLDNETYQKLENSIFNLDLMRKLESKRAQHRGILSNIREIVEAVLSYEDRIIQKVAYISIFQYLKPMFDNLYFQQNKSTFDQIFGNNTEKLSDYSFVKMQGLFEEWFSNISKNIPTDFIARYEQAFAQAFFKALRLQILNPYKFKINISMKKIVPYLQKDISFIIQILKQKFHRTQIIDEKIKKPFEKMLADMDNDTVKLMGMFENATLKNQQQNRKYILLVLNLRAKDQKAIGFVKQYKPKQYKVSEKSRLL